jgi:hypothetical protein
MSEDEGKKPVRNDPFDIPSVTRPEGYLFVDHRASPGIPEAKALAMGLDPKLVKEGKLYEAATLRCVHCPSVFIKNPRRTRERGHCFKCGGYICDACEAAAKMPGYVHMHEQEVIDKVTSGKYVMTGSTSLPNLIRKESTDG